MVRIVTLVALLTALVAWSTPVRAGAYCCGNTCDTCQCGMSNPYPCCNNGNGKSSNCTWGAWHMACCGWSKGLPGWSHAKYWAGNANAHPDYEVHGSPKAHDVACRDTGTYGHVAWVNSVNGGSISVHEQSCCEGTSCWPNCSYCIHDFVDSPYQASWYTGGFIRPKGSVVTPYCGDGSCNNGENCSSCEEDCGKCCGNGACDYGENCSSCEKDCGKCCGNGACDYGEDCASCEKDCGVCNEPPVGELETVNCQLIAGWALDPDVDWPIEVKLKVNGETMQTLLADGTEGGGHAGHRFALVPDHNLKDGQLYTIEAIAQDDKGLADGPISGSGKVLLCRNGMEVKGLWEVVYQDAAGVDITPLAGDGGWTAMQLFHPGGTGYPTSGLVAASATLSETPFEALAATLCGGFASGLYQGGMAVDGEHHAWLGQQDEACKPVTFPVSGNSVQLTLATLGLEYDGAQRECLLQDFRALSRGWEFAYSADARGLVWANEQKDRVAFAAAPEATQSAGRVRAQRTFSEPFDGFLLQAEAQGNGPGVTVEVPGQDSLSLADCLVGSQCERGDWGGETLAFHLEGSGDKNPGWRWEISDVRVFRDFEENLHPWTVVGDHAWGLTADLPVTGVPGLAFQVSTKENDFVPYGSVRGEVEFPAPEAEEVRGMLSYQLPGECTRGYLTMDGVPVRQITFGSTEEAFEVHQPGTRFGVALTALEGCHAESQEALLAVRNVSFLREGWWTTPSPTYAGIRDSRLEDCGLRFENLKWWGMSDQTAQGSLLVHRYLQGEWTGIRYRFSHTFEGPFFRFRMLLDNKSVKEYTLQSPTSRDESVEGKSFSEVGFQFAVATDDVYPYKWAIDVENLEVYRADLGWVPLCSAALAEPDLQGVAESVVDADVTSTVERSEGGPESPRSGCRVGMAGALPGLAVLLAALLLLLSGLRLRRGDR